jgi:predicted DNA-binding transcriptional regulator AlpA
MMVAIPEWMNNLPDHATIGVREICEIYGVPTGSIYAKLNRGDIPAPSFTSPRPCRRSKYRWVLGTIRAHVAANTSHPARPE